MTPSDPGSDLERTAGLDPLPEVWLRLLVENVREHAFIGLDPEGCVTMWNEGAERILGYTEAEILGGTADVIFTPEDRAAGAPERERAAARAEGRAEDERWHVRKDGSRFWGSGTMNAVTDEAGAHRGFVKVFRDDTARREVDEALRRHREELRQLADSLEEQVAARTRAYEEASRQVGRARDLFERAFHASPVASAISRLSDGLILDVNERFGAFFGYARHELIGKTGMELELWSESSDRSRLVARARSEGMVTGIELDVRTRSGEVRSVLGSVAVIEVADVPCALIKFLDATELRRTLEALRVSEDRFRSLFVSAPIGIATLDRGGRIAEANPALHAFLDYPPDALVGLEDDALTHADDRAESRALFADLVAGRRGIAQVEKRYVCADGGTAWAQVTAAAVRDAEGVPRFTLAMVQDVTERRRLERAAAEAVETERRRLSYELHDDVLQRLAGASLLSWTLADALAQEGNPRAGSAARVVDLVRDVAAQIRALSRALAPVDLLAEGLSEALERLCRTVNETHGIRCRLAGRKQARVEDPAVATHLFRIAQEAVANAARHAAPTEITLGLGRDARGIRLTIRDDGRGLSAEALAGTGGGLGLRTMRARAAALGGTLTVESAPEQGTTVTCQIPTSGSPPSPPASPLEG